MTNEQLAAIVASFLVANAASVAVAVKWVFQHALDYQLMKAKVEQLNNTVEQHKKDLKAAHDKIRNK